MARSFTSALVLFLRSTKFISPCVTLKSPAKKTTASSLDDFDVCDFDSLFQVREHRKLGGETVNRADPIFPIGRRQLDVIQSDPISAKVQMRLANLSGDSNIGERLDYLLPEIIVEPPTAKIDADTD